jgi:hypothetical protein
VKERIRQLDRESGYRIGIDLPQIDASVIVPQRFCGVIAPSIPHHNRYCQIFITSIQEHSMGMFLCNMAGS